MSSLTPFIRHEAGTLPGGAAVPDTVSGQYRPPLGREPLADQTDQTALVPPGQPDSPDVQLPPPLVPTQQREPLPEPAAAPEPVPMTDGTPLPCRQKNAAEFLHGGTSPVMAQYAAGLFSTQQHTHSAQPAPAADEPAVLGLVEWREDSPYG